MTDTLGTGTSAPYVAVCATEKTYNEGRGLKTASGEIIQLVVGLRELPTSQ